MRQLSDRRRRRRLMAPSICRQSGLLHRLCLFAVRLAFSEQEPWGAGIDWQQQEGSGSCFASLHYGISKPKPVICGTVLAAR